jgi:hypothetical protein
MSGVSFSVDGKGRMLVSWMSRDKVYWSLSDEGGKRFSPRVAAPKDGDQGCSMALTNRKGEVLLLWKEGQQVNWAIYTQAGKPTGERGTAGRLSGKNKPSAFVGTDDVFYVVY